MAWERSLVSGAVLSIAVDVMAVAIGIIAVVVKTVTISVASMAVTIAIMSVGISVPAMRLAEICQVVGCKSTVVSMVGIEVWRRMRAEVESIDVVLNAEVIMVDLVVIEWAVGVKVGCTWVSVPVVRCNSGGMWCGNMGIGMMWSAVRNDIMATQTVVDSNVSWCFVVGGALNKVVESWMIAAVVW